MQWFPKKAKAPANSTLRTVLPVTGTESKQPSAMINVVKLIDDSVPREIRESEEKLKNHISEIERLKLYIAGLKEVDAVWKKHNLVSLSKTGASVGKEIEAK